MWRTNVQTREWLLTAAVIVVPLIIAVVVTLWSLDQVRYRPKKRRPAAEVARETSGSSAQIGPEDRGGHQNRENAAIRARRTANDVDGGFDEGNGR